MHNKNCIRLFILHLFSVCIHAQTYHSICVEVRGQHVKLGFLGGFWFCVVAVVVVNSLLAGSGD